MVLETLRGGRWPIRDLWMSERIATDVADEVRRLAEGLGVEVRPADAEAIRARCHTDQHQGMLARVGEYPLQGLEELLEGSGDPGGLPARYILKAAIPLGFFLLALQGLSRIGGFFVRRDGAKGGGDA